MQKRALRNPILVGKVGAPHGIKGGLKIQSYTSPPENLLKYQPWWFKKDGGWQEVKRVNGQRHGDMLLVVLDHIKDRNQASQLTHTEIYIEREQLPRLLQGEYYWADLEGCEVKSSEGVVFGKVTHLISTGANDVMFVKGDKTICIPYLPGQVIKHIDLDRKQILVNWPDAL